MALLRAGRTSVHPQSGMLASSSGDEIASSAACTARSSPRAEPMPMSALPAPCMTDLTSARCSAALGPVSNSTVVPMGGGQTEKQVQLIVDFQPDIIMVTPSYMQVIIEEFRRQGLDPAAMSIKVGIFGAEPWTEAMRRDIEDSAGIDAVDIYGLSEVMGPGVANECIEAKDGPVIWEDHFYPEIIDPATGAVAGGISGEREQAPSARFVPRDPGQALGGDHRLAIFLRKRRLLRRKQRQHLFRRATQLHAHRGHHQRPIDQDRVRQHGVDQRVVG